MGRGNRATITAKPAMTGQTISHYEMTDKLTPNSYNITESPGK